MLVSIINRSLKPDSNCAHCIKDFIHSKPAVFQMPVDISIWPNTTGMQFRDCFQVLKYFSSVHKLCQGQHTLKKWTWITHVLLRILQTSVNSWEISNFPFLAQFAVISITLTWGHRIPYVGRDPQGLSPNFWLHTGSLMCIWTGILSPGTERKVVR